MNKENVYRYEAVEMCPHCMEEHLESNWFAENGYRAVCNHCGESILLCDECAHAEDNTGRLCDWDSKTEKCFRDYVEAYQI